MTYVNESTDGGPYHVETRLLICRTNLWTCFYKIGTSVVKDLRPYQTSMMENFAKVVNDYSQGILPYTFDSAGNKPLKYISGINKRDWFNQAILLKLHFLSFFLIALIGNLALHKKWSFPLRISSVNVTKSAATKSFPGDFNTFTGEIFNGKLYFLCSVSEIFLVPQFYSKRTLSSKFSCELLGLYRILVLRNTCELLFQRFDVGQLTLKSWSSLFLLTRNLL